MLALFVGLVSKQARTEKKEKKDTKPTKKARKRIFKHIIRDFKR